MASESTKTAQVFVVFVYEQYPEDGYIHAIFANEQHAREDLEKWKAEHKGGTGEVQSFFVC